MQEEKFLPFKRISYSKRRKKLKENNKTNKTKDKCKDLFHKTRRNKTTLTLINKARRTNKRRRRKKRVNNNCKSRRRTNSDFKKGNSMK